MHYQTLVCVTRSLPGVPGRPLGPPRPLSPSKPGAPDKPVKTQQSECVCLQPLLIFFPVVLPRLICALKIFLPPLAPEPPGPAGRPGGPSGPLLPGKPGWPFGPGKPGEPAEETMQKCYYLTVASSEHDSLWCLGKICRLVM